MTYIFRPGHYNVSADAAVYEPGGAALPWWNPDGLTPSAVCGAWQAKGAASLAASYLNLATLGNANIDPAIVGGVAPTWAGLTGWEFDGITQHLRTGVAAISGYSMLCRFVYLTGLTDRFVVGSRNDAGGLHTRFSLQPSAAANTRTGYGSGNFINTGTPLLAGVLGIAGQQGYRNGIADGPLIGAWDGPSIDLWLGGRNLNGALNTPANTQIQAFAIYSVALTAAQVLARATAMSLL